MNILIVDDTSSLQVKWMIESNLKDYKLLHSKYNFYLATSFDEANKLSTQFDMDLAFIDYDLNEARNGLQLDIVKESALADKKRSVLLVLSDYYDSFKPEIKNMIVGFSKNEFLGDIEKRQNFFKNAFITLEKVGKLLKLQRSNGELSYVKTVDVVAVALIGELQYVYLSDKTKHSILKSGIEKLYNYFRESNNGLVQINQCTIVNQRYVREDKTFPEDIVTDEKVSLKVTPIYKHLL